MLVVAEVFYNLINYKTMDRLSDFRFPGRKVVIAILICIVVSSPFGFLVQDEKLDVLLKVDSILLDVAVVYVLFWVIHKKAFGRYGAAMMLMSLIAIAYTIMAFM